MLTVVGGRHSGEVDTFEELRAEGSVTVLYCTVLYCTVRVRGPGTCVTVLNIAGGRR